MGTYTAKTRNIGKRPRSKRLRELGGTVINNSGAMPDLSGCELVSNKVTEVDQNSTDEQYPTAKLLYNLYAALGALIDALDEGKQNAIADLAAIRSGAALGATALQAITAAAGSDIGTVGTPSVTVSTRGSTTTLTFHQLKGEKGDKGDKGDTGATGPQGPAGSNATVTVDSALSSTSTNPVQNRVVKEALDGKAASSHTHTTIVGSYTMYGGRQNPNYFGVNRVGALMMNTTVNGNSQYKDWLFMDCYSGTDVGGGVAIGVNRQSLGAYIMRSAAARTAWAEMAELLGTHNYSSYALPLTGGTISDQAITTAKSVVEINAVCTAASGSNIQAYGLKVTLSPTQHGLGQNAAAIYASASAGYAGMFSGGVKVSATLTANSVSATTVFQTSDDRLKDYLGDFHFNLADLDRIPLRFFAFKADKERRVLLGTSAQAVQKVLPEIVGSSRTASEEDTEEYLNVDYSKLALVALDCVRQLRDEVATMKAEMAAMRAEIDKLKSGR